MARHQSSVVLHSNTVLLVMLRTCFLTDRRTLDRRVRSAFLGYRQEMHACASLGSFPLQRLAKYVPSRMTTCPSGPLRKIGSWHVARRQSISAGTIGVDVSEEQLRFLEADAIHEPAEIPSSATASALGGDTQRGVFWGQTGFIECPGIGPICRQHGIGCSRYGAAAGICRDSARHFFSVGVLSLARGPWLRRFLRPVARNIRKQRRHGARQELRPFTRHAHLFSVYNVNEVMPHERWLEMELTHRARFVQTLILATQVPFPNFSQLFILGH